MRNLIRVKKARIAASAAAVLVALTALLAAGQENAASAPKAPLAHKTAKFKQPKLKRGLLTIEGRKKNDVVALRLEAGQPGILQIDVGDDGSADFDFELAEIQRIAIEAGAGDDVVRIDESNGAFTNSIPTTIDGEGGDDILGGGSGAETLLGGAGIDTVDGNRGNDVAFLGSGDDTFVWDPGDGSDTIEGQEGVDRMLFNGANVAEQVELSANGPRLRFFRNIASVTMDTDGVERVDFNALGGADLVTVNDLRGTDVTAVNVDLAAAGGVEDNQSDRVVVNGTNGDDAISVTRDAGDMKVSGLAATIAVLHPEFARDQLEINGLAAANRIEVAGTNAADQMGISGDASLGVIVVGLPAIVAIHHQDGASDSLSVTGLAGDDVLIANGLADQPIPLTLDGGTGDDTLGGSQGVDTLLGGAGVDSIDGNRGNDVAFMGGGDDTFVWDPGDGSDTIEGQDGVDRMLFNGANVAEQVELSANGSRLRFFRNIASVTMDTDGVERVDFNALGGADLVTVNDLSATDVSAVNVDLSAADGQPDRVVVGGTNGDDAIAVTGDAAEVKVSGLAATVAILHPEAANDRLEINTQAGRDTVDPAGLAAGTIQLFVNGALVP